jgi:hypothetical protein
MTLTAPARALPDVDRAMPAEPTPLAMHERFLEALTASAMGPRLAAVLSGPPVCHVLDAKYEPGIYGHILYEHAGRLVRGDLDGESGAPTATTSAPLVVDPGILVWPFPGDPDLASLSQAMDPAVLGPIVRRADGDGGGAGCRIDLLRYRPGKRATLLVTMGSSGRRYVAKVYHRPDKAAAVAAEAVALEASAAGCRDIRLTPFVTHVPELALVIHRAVGGTPLDAVIGGNRRSSGGAQHGIVAAARALAEFHALPAVTGRVRPVEKELVRFGERADRIASVSPSFGSAAASLARRIADAGATLPEAPIGPVHGDCKPSAFLLGDDGGPPYLLDLDHHGLSDQTGDVGTFTASLRQLDLRNRLAGRKAASSPLLTELGDAFLEAYLAASGRHHLRSRVVWQETVALERKALRAYSRAPRSRLPAALLVEADRRLDQLKERQ